MLVVPLLLTCAGATKPAQTIASGANGPPDTRPRPYYPEEHRPCRACTTWFQAVTPMAVAKCTCTEDTIGPTCQLWILDMHMRAQAHCNHDAWIPESRCKYDPHRCEVWECPGCGGHMGHSLEHKTHGTRAEK